jgi:hypothetical protein
MIQSKVVIGIMVFVVFYHFKQTGGIPTGRYTDTDSAKSGRSQEKQCTQELSHSSSKITETVRA